ncbi:L,D-transpeptidase family protein [Actinoallomurus iriomotensis]|jgi:lipoprotein-anchoring transpeptidase ErfK/SrfK|uniref:Peptidoglycan-binding protein n=1 Tax=Actinoallomurus iriomotensis TaxID=478107 RepID=A0A9W6RP24_9ACTN|nr:L,D-transpeptidase family protein [Actinoallomurus iriomotensis]GLY79264.1 peptidoglycan-binding protein [Actinoallomurus iriomotensis]
MQVSLRRTVALAAMSASVLVPALAAPATASPARASLQAAAIPTMQFGDRGPAVKQLQERLKAMHYDPGTIDGIWGNNTSVAVWAFQKVNHISPASRVGSQTKAALAHPRTPAPLVPKGAKNRAEVDIKHQLLYIYKSGRLVLTSHISSGSEKRYYSQGHWSVAHTPRGDFSVYRKAAGWETSPLGKLYKANYFRGGYAIHGEPEVPLHPASHGCVRVPMHTSNIVAALLPIGTRVYVRG